MNANSGDRSSQSPDVGSPSPPVTATAILQAVARGWCHPKNAGKEMDADLALAICAEVNDLLAAIAQSAPSPVLLEAGKEGK